MFRLHSIKKELAAYEQEVEQQAAKVQRMRDEQQDEYDIKKQVHDHAQNFEISRSTQPTLQTEVLAESEMMIPNTKQRMMAAADALSTFIVSAHCHIPR